MLWNRFWNIELMFKILFWYASRVFWGWCRVSASCPCRESWARTHCRWCAGWWPTEYVFPPVKKASIWQLKLETKIIFPCPKVNKIREVNWKFAKQKWSESLGLTKIISLLTWVTIECVQATSVFRLYSVWYLWYGA